MTTIAKVPTSAGSMKRNSGCEKAPAEILKQLETLFSKESGYEISTPKVVEIRIDRNNPDNTFTNIQNSDADIYLGGDHSITYSAFQTLKNPEAGLIILDAHPDLDTTTETPTHEDYLRRLVEKKLINPRNIILIGIRNYGKNEMDFIKQNHINFYTCRHIFSEGIQSVTDAITETANTFREFYLSIDIDIIDPSAAPGTGMPEPAGLSARESLYLIQRLRLLKNLRKADLVEVNPDKDTNAITTRLAARMLLELL